MQLCESLLYTIQKAVFRHSTDSPVAVPTMDMLKAEFKMVDDLRVEEDDSEDKR